MFFHALTFAGSRGSCLNTRKLGRVFKHCPRDQASVIAMKQTCVILILAYFTWFQYKPHWKCRLNIKNPFSYTWFLKTKWNVISRHNVIYTCAMFSRTKASAKWSVTAATHSSVPSSMQTRVLFRLFQVKAMFKQHVNLMIWTWLLLNQCFKRSFRYAISVKDLYSDQDRHQVVPQNVKNIRRWKQGKSWIAGTK